MSWYVIQVETGYEDEVCRFIDQVKPYLMEYIDYKLLNPKRLIYERKNGVRKKVARILFPGYILVETNQIVDFYHRISGRPHIIRFLRNSGCFLEVRSEEMQHILSMANKEGFIGISQGLIINDTVRIIEGPLLDREGIIKKIDKRKGRAKVEFLINNNPLLIDLGVDIIQKIRQQ